MNDPFESAAPATPIEPGRRMAERAGDALQRGRAALDELDPAEWRADVEDTIRGRPILSVCVAAVLGFMIGRMIRN